MDSQSPAEDEPDPVVASYDIYVKPRLKDGKMVYILQFPNRNSKQSYSIANSSLPLELRLKEKAGLVEIDVPIDAFRNYDREKGIKWGEALRKSEELKGEGGGYGLGGGFGIGGGQSARPRSARQGTEDEGLTQEALMRDFATSVSQGRVLSKQTLGGQAIPKDSTTPQYMIGAFQDNQLHLTPVDQIVPLRPQFHHVDALTELERGRSREPVTGRAAEPRSIHMTVKPAADGEEEATDTMAERIRAIQEEPWRKLTYVDEDSAAAREVYNNNLIAENTEAAPKLVSSMTASEYLDAISAPRAPAKLAKLKKLRNMGIIDGTD